MTPRVKKMIACGVLAVTALVPMRPCLAGPPFLTDDPVPVEYGHWEINAFSMATFARGATAGLGPAVEVNYGGSPNVQMHVQAPLAFNASAGASPQWGGGDGEFGAKMRILNTEPADWWPQMAFYPLVDVPTGNAARGLGTGSVHAYLPLWLQKDFGPWTTYGGGGYWINPGAGNRNYWFSGWLLQRKITESLALAGEIYHQTAYASAGPGNVSAAIGSRDMTGFNVGGTYDFDPHLHLLFSAGRALQNGTASSLWTCYIGLQWTL
jgi:hypothetical protein